MIATLLLSLAAPTPYAPQGAAESVFDAKTQMRANALASLIRKPEFLARVKADDRLKAALMPRLSGALSPDGTHLKLRVSGCEERQALALLRAIEQAIAAPPDKAEAARLMAAQTTTNPYYEERMIRFRRGGARVRGGYDPGYVILHDPSASDIRFNPPTLKNPARRVQP
ncbi:MAG: hypothetical protein K2W96_02920 [Gemmataceae bacterium]|nr:hypothetical protein [Gemmataceae bacterium]